MENHVAKFESFEEADRADREYYRSLTPAQRIDVLVELNRHWPGLEDGTVPNHVVRVYRIVKLEDQD